LLSSPDIQAPVEYSVSRGRFRRTMPRVRTPKFRRVRARVNWERPPGGRLLRLDNAAHYVDSDILVYNIDSVNAVAVAQHTTDQRIPPLPLQESTKSNDVFNFEKLERHNTLESILGFLGVSDIEALSKVSSFLSDYINRHYLLRLSLPLPPGVSEKLENRKVLALTSCCNLAWLPGIPTFEPFNQLNLTKLRELKLIGKNLNIYAYPHELSQEYHNSLQYLLETVSKTAPLKKLEILTDSTNRSVQTAVMIKRLVNLDELVLHGIGHFNNSATYDVDVKKANPVIHGALLNKSISVLRLVKFQVNTEISKDPLVVHSETLKQLSVSECKDISLDLMLPALTTLDTELREFMFKIDHYIDKKMVETNCPLLCTWNGVNVKEVAKKAGARNWAEHLTFPETGWTRMQAESGNSDSDSDFEF